MRELVDVTYDVNRNLGNIIARTDGVMRRQNLLIVLCIVAMSLMVIQIFLGLSLQAQQKAVATQLLIVDAAKDTLTQDVALANRSLKETLSQLEAVRKQQETAPTITADKSGKLGLSVSLDETAKKAVSSETPPEKVVIPLKPAQSRLEH